MGTMDPSKLFSGAGTGVGVGRTRPRATSQAVYRIRIVNGWFEMPRVYGINKR